MAKYREIQNAIESVFSSTSWKAGDLSSIKVVPSNLQGKLDVNEFLRIEVLPSARRFSFNEFGSAGQVIIQIYSEGNKGITRSMEIADTLDEFLQVKTFKTTNGSLQTNSSAVSFLGVDPDDSSLFRADYSVGFNYYA